MLLTTIMEILEEEGKHRKDILNLLFSFTYFETSQLINVSLIMQVNLDLSLNFCVVNNINIAQNL